MYLADRLLYDVLVQKRHDVLVSRAVTGVLTDMVYTSTTHAVSRYMRHMLQHAVLRNELQHASCT